MTSEILPTDNSKKRRILIITSDERMVEQLRTNFNPFSFQTIVLDPESDNDEQFDSSVGS
jgi:hypothetical protein